VRQLRLVSICTALLAGAAIASAQDATAVVADVARAMGMSGLKAITFSGTAAFGNFGQSRTISFGLASTAIPNYIRTIDFEHAASLATGDTQPPQARGGPPPHRPWKPGRHWSPVSTRPQPRRSIATLRLLPAGPPSSDRH